MAKVEGIRDLLEMLVALFVSAYFGSLHYNLFLAVLIGVAASFAVRLPFAITSGIKAGWKAWNEFGM